MFKLTTRVGASQLLPVVAASGERPVFVALGSDTVSTVAKKVSVYGAANVCFLDGDRIQVIAWNHHQTHDEFVSISEI